MDNDTSLGSDQRQELAISFAASSMINASDRINADAYQANLKRIQEVKEVVRTLEMNNETAHKNFLIDQLEKRAKDGRDAQDMLVRLRNQPGIPEMIPFTPNVPSDKPEVILPTTATLVEVPESHPTVPYPSVPPTISHSQTVRQGRHAMPQGYLPTQVKPYYPDNFRYYQSPQYNPPRVSVNAGQTGWYNTRSVPSQPGVHGPVAYQTDFQPEKAQHSLQPRSNYPPQIIPLSTVAPTPGHHTSPSEWAKMAPVQGGPSINPTYGEQSIRSPSTTSLPPVPPSATNSPHGLSSLGSTSQVQMPLQGVPSVPATRFGYPPTVRSHQKPVESHSQPVSVAVSKPVVAVSELPQLTKTSHQPPQQIQKHPQPPLQPPQHSQTPQQLQPHQPPQPLPQSQHHPQQYPSQRPVQLPQAQSHGSSHSADPVRPAETPQHQPSQSPNLQAQAQQRGVLPRVDQTTFIKIFKVAIQRETSSFMAFWSQAKAAGISDDWFYAAINSVPRDQWQSVLTRVNQLMGSVDGPPPASSPRQPESSVPSPNVPVAVAQVPLAVTSVVHTASPAQQTTEPGASTPVRTSHRIPDPLYSAHLQYYAGQATKSALSAQSGVATMIPSESIAPTPTTPATNVSRVNGRSPRDANKATLARDILRSLGKAISIPQPKTGGEPAKDEAIGINRESGQSKDVASSQPLSRAASPEPPSVPPATPIVDVNPLYMPSAAPNARDELPPINTPGPSAALKEKHGRVIVPDGPIMIDLTLEDSDECVDDKGQEPNLQIQTANVPLSPPASATEPPLLESLSLEESPVDGMVDGDNADARMHSPRLSLSTAENMGPQSPLPASAEAVLPSFEPLPRGASVHSLDGKLPLFLPSPPVSSSHSKLPEMDLEMIVDEGEGQASVRQCSVDVDKMEIDTNVETPPRVSKRRKHAYVLVPPAPLYVKRAKLKGLIMREDAESDLEGAVEDEEIRYTAFEQIVIEESKSLLLERRCGWSNCGAILNCATNLLAHLKNHVREDSEAPFLCHWANCRRQFGVKQERDVHLERHAIRPLPCPFAGCDKRFDKPLEVMQHEVEHQKEDGRERLIRKRTYEAIVPAIPARLGRPPQWLPSYRVIPRRVLKCRIAADRHALIGPWVLWNIWSPVELNMRKQNTSIRGRATRQAVEYDVDDSEARRDDYDFLVTVSSHSGKNVPLGDLDSTQVTMRAARGLTLWGTDGSVRGARGSATPEEAGGEEEKGTTGTVEEEEAVRGMLMMIT